MHASESARELPQSCRRVIQEAVGCSLSAPEGTRELPLSYERHDYLLGALKDLYWNDLEWENVTAEERMEGGSITELTLPGVLLTEFAEDALAEPHPAVIEHFLVFLAWRVIQLREVVGGGPSEEGAQTAIELRMT